MRWLVILAIVLATNIASADPESVPEVEKSPGVALALSGLTTVGGIAALLAASNTHYDKVQSSMAVVGLVSLAVGPTLGHFYAGKTWNTGLKIRLASLAGAVLGVAVFASADPFGPQPNNGAVTVGAVLVVASAIAYGAGTIYEVGSTVDAVKRPNKRALTIAPATNGRTTGITVLGRF